MSIIKDYYGHKGKEKTYLEIYSTDENLNKTVHRQLSGADAYDTWHLSDLLKEIMVYDSLMTDTISLDKIPRKEKNLILYLLLLLLDKQVSVWELGSSLFEMIEGLKLVEKFFSQKKMNTIEFVDKIRFRGIEISDLLSKASVKLHKNYDIKIFPDIEKIEGNFDILYDRNVSSYAFTDAKGLSQFINKFNICYMNLLVSRNESFSTIRLGKRHTYFSLKELIKQTEKQIFHLFGYKAPVPLNIHEPNADKNVIEGFFLICDKNFAESFYQMSLRDKEVSEYFTEKKISLNLAENLL